MNEVEAFDATHIQDGRLKSSACVLAADYSALLISKGELGKSGLKVIDELRAAEAKINALQQRLTAADERADTATLLIQRIVANFDTEIEYHEDVEPNDLEHDQVLKEMREFLCPPKPEELFSKPCACPGCDSPRRADSPFCIAHRSAKSRTRGQDPMTAEGLEWLMQNDGYQQ